MRWFCWYVVLIFDSIVAVGVGSGRQRSDGSPNDSSRSDGNRCHGSSDDGNMTVVIE